jgi:DUF4097 and DUF4098 domain-containing protein YvlB
MMMAAGATLALQAADQTSIKRLEPQRLGNSWEQRVECSLLVREGGRLMVRVDAGAVSVKPGPADHMECQVRLRAQTRDEAKARRQFEAYELSVRPLEGGGAYLSGRSPRDHRNSTQLGAEFQISVPVRFNVDVETKGGGINVEKLDGELVAVTAGGGIRTGDVAGATRVETAGGSINLGNIGARLEARTAGGGIRVGDVRGDATLETSGGEIVAGQIAGTLRAETAGGDVVLRGAVNSIEARTAGGQIQIGKSGGSVRAQTAGGSIRLLGSQGPMEVKTAGGSIDLWQIRSAVDAATAAGHILAQIDPADKTFAPCELDTASGDVLVYLPADLALTIDAAIDVAAGHEILTDFPLQIQRGKDNFVLRTLRGSGDLNGGGKVLRIRTIAGNIEIRKLDPRNQEELKERQDSSWKRWEEKEDGRERPRD